MSKGTWTDEQWQAITARDSNILVAAAAGAGKTAVLVERIIKRVSDEQEPLDVDRMLVVTFTNAAAAEMRERIGGALIKSLNANPQSRHLERQLSLLNRAPITTLHSFCLELLRQNFYRLDLDPNFRIADDTEASLLRLEVLEELFEAHYEVEEQAFTRLVECYGGERDDSPLQDLVLRLHSFSRSQPWPAKWLERIAEEFNVPDNIGLDHFPWVGDLKESIFLELDRIETALKRALSLSRRPGGPAIYEENLKDDLVIMAELKASCSLAWEEMRLSFQNVAFKKLKSCRGDIDEQLKKEVAKLRDEAKKAVSKLQGTYFSRSSHSYIRDFQQLAPLMSYLQKLVVEFEEAYRKAKLKRSLVDFNDLEHLCLQVLLEPESSPENLMPSSLALELRERFAEVLVDEYQDINAVQETILQLVSRQHCANSNLFMVGDVKQSIYRFRLAEPGLFLQKYKGYGEAKNLGQRIDLARNFRSRKEVVHGTNFIFRQIMTERFGEMAYDAKAELVHGAAYPEPEATGTPLTRPIELHLIDRKTPEQPLSLSKNEDETDQGETEVEELSGMQLEARAVGRSIRKMLATAESEPFLVYDSGTKTYRPVTYRDMVILLRATKNSANIFLEEFRQLGIPAYAELGTGYLGATEVETMLALLKVIDNPRQDIPLAAVLRSPIISSAPLSANDLAEIRLSADQGDFYQAVKQRAQVDDELGQVLKDFFQCLDRWRTQARQGTLADLIWSIYRETGYYDYAGAMPGGAQRQANLRALHDRARQYEQTTYRGLFRFLRFIERLQDSGSDLGAARALSENENVVRIMSIHKSKGLEFPVVFVAGLGKQFNLLDLNKEMLLHKDLGLGPNLVDPEARLSYPSLPKLAIKNKMKLELLAEELRVLYVAMTRAREKLFLVGAVKDLTKAVGNWSQHWEERGLTLPEASLAAAKCCLDWIAAAVIRHEKGLDLRALAGIDEAAFPNAVPDPSQWEIKLWDNNQLQASAAAEEFQDLEGLWEKVSQFEPLEREEIELDYLEKVLNWTYPHGQLTKVTAKLAVSEVKERFADVTAPGASKTHGPAVIERPKFLQEMKGLSGAERGSALHLVMQHLDLQHQPNRQQLENLLAELEAKEIISSEQRAVININGITEFLKSPLGIRMGTAAGIYKEIPFSLMLPAHEVYADLESAAEQVLVQGVIDCLIDEGDGFVLLDYKTDWVTEGQLENLVENYRGQLYLYAKAIEKILRRPVKEKYLYLFELGRAVLVT